MSGLEANGRGGESAVFDPFAQFLAGDTSALGPLLESCRFGLEQQMEGYLRYSWLRFHCSAGDIVQKTFLKVLRKRDQFQGDTRAEWELWLHTIANRILIDMARNLKRFSGGSTVAEFEGSQGTGCDQMESTSSVWVKVAREEAKQLMLKVLNTLPSRDRQIILLRYYRGLAWEEVGEVIGCAADTARMRCHRTILPQLTVRLNFLNPPN